MSDHHYVHGDLENPLSLKYYCSPCSEFCSVEHFNQENHPNYGQYHNYNVYRRGVEMREYHQSRKSKFIFVDSSVENIFAHLVKPKLIPFYVWLLKQKHRDDPVGWYARESERTCDYPIYAPIEEYSEYVISHLSKRCIGLGDGGGLAEAELGMFQALDEFDALRKSKSVARYIPLSLRFKILERDERRCQLCGATTEHGTTLEIDHIIPVSKGGDSTPDNLQVLCFECNRGKGSR